MARPKKKPDTTAEERIKEAARKLFTEKGYDAVKTRDIAAEAGINLALLNYYFRSKENLFEIVMLGNFEEFMQNLIQTLSDETSSTDQVIEKAVTSYIDMLSTNPDLPLFILNSVRNNSANFPGHMSKRFAEVRNSFIQRISKGMNDGQIQQMNVGHFMLNFMGLVLFPFVARPMISKVNHIKPEDFKLLMEERKKLVPVWLKAMMAPKKSKKGQN
ncbi:MAG TPA: TetR/AcrR family transcriptional regulator [Chitinophagales bacterium]|nr:TetR/AcrR family transcriptional regulator [Chitinophagales bacterium]